jgi:hypothetical protein
MQAIIRKNNDANLFIVVHPLDDRPEVKRSADLLGQRTLPPSVKWSLISLRGYLLLMGLMVAYDSLNLSGLINHLK